MKVLSSVISSLAKTDAYIQEKKSQQRRLSAETRRIRPVDHKQVITNRLVEDIMGTHGNKSYHQSLLPDQNTADKVFRAMH